MNIYRSKYPRLKGSSYSEVITLARKEFHHIQKFTKRQPYVRSNYFSKNKIFLSLFWDHLDQKHRKDRMKRLQFYKAAIDLLRNSTKTPDTIFSNEDKNILLHRFYGITSDDKTFIVQVKEDKRSNRKDFISVFDLRSKK